MLYLAYGSNLNIEQMAIRCPKSRKVGPASVKDYRLVFRDVADVEPAPGQTLHLGAWRITPDCERVLDRYEGCRPDGRGLYRRELWPVAVRDGGKERVEDALIYVMNRKGYYRPSMAYYNGIVDGYADFGLPEEALQEAFRLSGQLEDAERAGQRKRQRQPQSCT